MKAYAPSYDTPASPTSGPGTGPRFNVGEIRSRTMDNAVFAWLTERDIAFEKYYRVEHVNFQGDWTYHTATLRLTANGNVIDIFKNLTHGVDGTSIFGQSGISAELNEPGVSGLTDTLRRWWFNSHEALIETPKPLLIFTNPSNKVLGTGQTLAEFGDADPVFDWGLFLKAAWLPE